MRLRSENNQEEDELSEIELPNQSLPHEESKTYTNTNFSDGWPSLDLRNAYNQSRQPARLPFVDSEP